MENPILYKDSSGNTALAGAAIGSVAGPVGAVIGAVVGTAAMVAGAVYYKEHTSNASPSKRNKHEEGQSRKKRDSGGERGDARRVPRKDKRK